MIDELYINGVSIDVKNIQIPYNRTSPYFSDVTRLKNDASYTVKIPPTKNNLLAFGYSSLAEMNSDFPYKIHKATAYEYGYLVFKDAEVKMLESDTDDISIQFVWGYDRNRYKKFFETKLNEIEFNGTSILESDWVSVWNKDCFSQTGKKFKYLDYYSTKRDTEVIIGQEAPPVPEQYASVAKIMTKHPFVSFNNILDVVNKYSPNYITFGFESVVNYNEVKLDRDVSQEIEVGDELVSVNYNNLGHQRPIVINIDGKNVRFNTTIAHLYNSGGDSVIATKNVDFSKIKSRLTNKGLILGGVKDNYTEEKDYIIGTPYTIYAEDNYVTMFNVSESNKYYNSFFKITPSGIMIGAKTEYVGIEEVSVNLNFDFSVLISAGTGDDLRLMIGDNFEASPKVSAYVLATTEGNRYRFKGEFNFKLRSNLGYANLVFSAPDPSYSQELLYLEGDYFKFTVSSYKSLCATDDAIANNHNGRYNCIANLPEITIMEFIQNMMIMTGMFCGYGSSGEIEFYSLDEFKSKIESGDVYDFTGIVSERKRDYRFNSNAQKNYIRYSNYNDMPLIEDGVIAVDDETLANERDLYLIDFDLGYQEADDKCELMEYTQKISIDDSVTPNRITFDNQFEERNSICVCDIDDTAKNNGILPTEIISDYYGIYSDIVNRPTLRECDVNLPFDVRKSMDYSKPVYVGEFGRYCVHLESDQSGDDQFVSKLLLINKKI